MKNRTHALPICLTNATCVTPDRIERRPLYVSRGRFVPAEPAGARAIDLRGNLVFPGLVNAHEHLHLNCFPRLPHAEPFPNSYVWMDSFQPFMADETVRAARAIPVERRYRQGALKNLLSGVTTVSHHDPWHPVFEEPDFPVRVVRRFGWSHSLGLGRPDSTRSVLRYGPPVRESFCATPANCPWIVHLAEGTDEVAASELCEVDRLGCLAANSVLVHGVGLTDADIDRVHAAGAGVVWCPESNLQILGRTLDPRRLAAKGRLALGSDSRLTAPGGLLSDLRLAAVHSDLAPPELLRLVTEGGSRLLRLPQVGGLEPGQRADLLIVRDTGDDPYRALLTLERRDIRAVVRDGIPRITDPDLADWFDASAVSITRVCLDGRPKLCVTELLGALDTSTLEPGLEVETKVSW